MMLLLLLLLLRLMPLKATPTTMTTATTNRSRHVRRHRRRNRIAGRHRPPPSNSKLLLSHHRPTLLWTRSPPIREHSSSSNSRRGSSGLRSRCHDIVARNRSLLATRRPGRSSPRRTLCRGNRPVQAPGRATTTRYGATWAATRPTSSSGSLSGPQVPRDRTAHGVLYDGRRRTACSTLPTRARQRPRRSSSKAAEAPAANPGRRKRAARRSRHQRRANRRQTKRLPFKNHPARACPRDPPPPSLPRSAPFSSLSLSLPPCTPPGGVPSSCRHRSPWARPPSQRSCSAGGTFPFTLRIRRRPIQYRWCQLGGRRRRCRRARSLLLRPYASGSRLCQGQQPMGRRRPQRPLYVSSRCPAMMIGDRGVTACAIDESNDDRRDTVDQAGDGDGEDVGWRRRRHGRRPVRRRTVHEQRVVHE